MHAHLPGMHENALRPVVSFLSAGTTQGAGTAHLQEQVLDDVSRQRAGQRLCLRLHRAGCGMLDQLEQDAVG